MPSPELQELLELAQHVLTQLSNLLLQQTDAEEITIRLVISHS